MQDKKFYISLKERIDKLEKALKTKVLGQEHNYPPLLKILARGEAGLTSPKRPNGSFISLGPTGVGKTETVKVICEDFFNDPKSLIRLNMSEFKSIDDIKQLLGSPSQKGFLQIKLEESGDRARIFLLDEIEKAHKEILDLLLQILDEGWLDFQNGDSWSFRNMYIIATSNVGAEYSKASNPDPNLLNESLEKQLRIELRPELVERFSHILTYQRLSTRNQAQIARLEFRRELERLSNITGLLVEIEKEDEIVNLIREKGYTPLYGARRLRNVVESLLQQAYLDSLSAGLFSGILRRNRNRLSIYAK